MNRAEFIGNLGQDARLGKAGDTPVANFSIAVNDRVKGEEVTTWVSCALFGKTADAIGKYLVKGKMVFVSGKISLEEFTTKDGEVRHNLALKVFEVELLGGGSRDQGQPSRPRDNEDPFA